MVAVKVKYGRKHSWDKAYGFPSKELKDFNIEVFKNRIYQESRIWIKEAELQAEALEKLKAAKADKIYLD